MPEEEERTAGFVGAHEQVLGAPTDWLSLNTAPARPGAEANAVAAKAGRAEVFVPADLRTGEILDVSPAREQRAERRAERREADERDPRQGVEDAVEADLDGR
ncbi:hypothetical protein [Nonomuraea sp. NPDC050310]|uniref:hypothetical protein n=1 Tax=Nonomuraea sp. NPDC050310 TaxID=3154935 RepID=UPI003400D1CD